MNENDYPLVSIIIPVFNGSNYLGEAIESALNQTYKNIEVIVVNDGSTDGGKTDTIALGYGDKINYIVKENGGVSSAFNLGIAKMNGKYFSWLSHDDVYYPNKIEVQIEYLKENNLLDKEVILYSDFDIVKSDSSFKQKSKIEHVEPEYFRWLMLITYPLNGNTVLIPKSCFDNVGLFNEEYKTQQDYDMWVRLSLHYSFIHIPKSLIKSRTHLEQGSITMSELMKKNTNEFYLSYLKSIDDNELLLISNLECLEDVYELLAKNYARRVKKDISFYCCHKYRDNLFQNRYINYYLLLLKCLIIYSAEHTRAMIGLFRIKYIN